MRRLQAGVGPSVIIAARYNVRDRLVNMVELADRLDQRVPKMCNFGSKGRMAAYI